MSDQTAKKTIKKTNSNQFKKLVEFMEHHEDLAKGLAKFGATKKDSKNMWEELAVDLNSLGPPYRKGNEWNKVWLDYKNKLKAKIATHKKDIKGTGGGPYVPLTLSPLEQTVDTLLSLQNAVNPNGVVFGPDDDIPPSNKEDKTGEEQLDDTSPNLEPKEKVHRKKMTASTEAENERLTLLKTQTETQEKILDSTRGIEKNLQEISRYSRKIFEIKKEQLEILKAKEKRKIKENTEKIKRHEENIKVKLRKIDIKVAKYNVPFENY